MCGHLGSFVRNTVGGISIMLAVSSLPLLVLTGTAVDLVRAQTSKQYLTQALDSATLAVAREVLDNNTTTAKTLGTTYIKANLPADLAAKVKNVSFTMTDTLVTGSATTTVDGYMTGLVGRTGLDVVASAQAVRSAKYVEVSLALDNTGSMAGTKITALRSAAKSLVEILYGGQTTSPNLKVAVVPYVTTVNIKNELYQSSWMDVNAQSSQHGENFDETAGPVNHFTLFDNMPNADWKGCVESRPMPYDVTDDAPDASNPETLHVPYFWPDEPPDSSGNNYDNSYYSNDYSPNGSTGPQKQKNTAKYTHTANTIDEVGPDTFGPNRSCPEPLTPLTNDKTRVINALNAMGVWNDSGTNGAIGLYWGWAVLSPSEPFSQGAAYTDRETRKILVLMTDGENQIYGGWDNHNKSHYSGYGYLALNHLGSTDKDVAKGKIDDRMKLLCTNIKATGIVVYTVTFQVSGTALKNTYRDCATDPSKYFDSPSESTLKANFKVIAREIADLRISK
jgi:Flp pilus assembly protein TadG